MSTNEESEDENSILPFIIISLTDDRGQIKFCQNLIANLFEKGISPCRAEFPDVKIKRQTVDHYLKGICTPSHQYGIYKIELQSPSKFHGKYPLQTDEVEIEFSKVFTEYIKSIQHQNSQRANSMFTNEVFRIVFQSKTNLIKISSKIYKLSIKLLFLLKTVAHDMKFLFPRRNFHKNRTILKPFHLNVITIMLF